MNNLKTVDQIEVLISNLLHLKNDDEQTFEIPYDDVVVTLQTALRLCFIAQTE